MKYLSNLSIRTFYRFVILLAATLWVVLYLLVLWANYVKKEIIAIENPGKTLSRLAQQNVNALQSTEQRLIFCISLIIIFALILCVFAYRFAGRRVVKPIEELYNQADMIATGNYTVCNHIEFKNELGSLGAALNHMSEFIEKDITDRKQDQEQLFSLNTQLSKTLNELKQHHHRIELIHNMNDMLQTCHHSHEAYSIIALTAQELFKDLSGGLAIFNRSANHLETVAQWGDEQIIKPIFMQEDCWALRGGHTYIVADSKKSLICNHFITPPTHSYISTPLVVQSEIIGVLSLLNNKMIITKAQQQLTTSFCEVVKLSLANLRLRETLRDQAIHDTLTGLFNRRYLDEVLPRELENALRENNRIYIAILDLDHFKRFNDTYGHEAGDEILKFVGKLLQKTFLGNEIACRLGGEEFIVIFLNSDLNTARQRLEQISKLIKKGHIYFQERFLPQITISIGLAQAGQHKATVEEALRAADEALYAAKIAGRDRIEIFQDK